MFKRIGTGDEGSIELVKYNKADEHKVKCPACNKELSLMESNGILRQGSKLVIGKIIMRCNHCGKFINV